MSLIRHLKLQSEFPLPDKIMEERELFTVHTTIMHGVHQYLSVLDQRVRCHLKPTNDYWRVDIWISFPPLKLVQNHSIRSIVYSMNVNIYLYLF